MRFFLFLFLFNFSLFGGTLEIGERDSYWTLPYCEYAPVDNMSDTPQNLTSDIWIKDKDKLQLNEKNRAFWMKIKIKNQDALKKELFLMSKRNFVYHIEYYMLDGERKIVEHRVDGYQVVDRFSNYDGLHRIFHLTLNGDEEVELFFKIQSFNMGTVSFNIVTKEFISSFYKDYSFFKGLFFGILIIMALYNFILYFFFRYSIYLYYVLYVSLYILYSSAYGGYLHQYTNLSAVNITMLQIIGYTGFLISIGVFIKRIFVLITKEEIKIIRWIRYIQWYLLFRMIIELTLLYNDDFVYMGYISNLENLVLPIYYIAILLLLYKISQRRADNIALWYLISWGIIGFVGFLQIMASMDILSMERGFDYFFDISMIFETLLFSIFLSMRSKEVEKEKEEKEKLLVQQSKLASMGEMIVSIAHQWRQPLAEINGIVMNLDLDYQNKKLDNIRFQKHLLDIENTTQHLSETMNDFMDFFNPKKEINHFAITELFEHTINLVHMSSQNRVKIVYDIDNNIDMYGYRSELIQVLLILINNSIDAFVTSDIVNPKIDMSATKKDDYIYFRIEDNGGGIPIKIIDKIYEPYFTSKPKTQGTGLGLYILKIIIEKSMLGEVSLKNSKDGVVCNFKIRNLVLSEKLLI